MDARPQIRLDVVVDTVCPWCWIGKRRLERALSARPEIDFQIGYRPFELNPDLPAEGVDRKAYVAAKFGDRDRARQIYEAVVDAGQEVGIDFDFERMGVMPNSRASHRLIRWASAAGVQAQVVEAVFERYFMRGDNIGDPLVLIEVASEAGMDAVLVGELLMQGADVELIEQEEMVAQRLGVQGVPFTIVERQYGIVGAQDAEAYLQVFDKIAAGEPPTAQ
jgi:predicted DsbA family dithiol-disulfide isomerase